MPRRSACWPSSGVGNALIDVAGFTLLGRMAPDEVLARVFGVLESLVAVSIGIGAVVAAWAVEAWGPRPALVAIGLLCPVLAAASWWRLRALDRTVGVHDEAVGLLRRVPMLRHPPVARRRAARSRAGAGRRRCGWGGLRQGDVGDRYYVVESGDVEVVGNGRVVATLGPGEGFGEIALLRRTPRTATVVARSDVRLRRCSRTDSFRSSSGSRRARARRRSVSIRCSTASTPSDRPIDPPANHP